MASFISELQWNKHPFSAALKFFFAHLYLFSEVQPWNFWLKFLSEIKFFWIVARETTLFGILLKIFAVTLFSEGQGYHFSPQVGHVLFHFQFVGCSTRFIRNDLFFLLFLNFSPKFSFRYFKIRTFRNAGPRACIKFV